MIDAPLALAFTAGMVATVNPCGFAMLPAYLSFFLGLDHPEAQRSGVASALRVGLTVSFGFLVVFALAGLAFSAGARAFLDYVPWVSLVIGAGLVALGIVLLTGRHVAIRLPTPRRAVRGRDTRALVVFGVSYAIASLSCTLPVFLTVVSSTVTRESLAAGIASFVAYAAGMGLVVLTLTLAVGMARDSFVNLLRSAGRFVDKAAAALLVVAGTYLVYYWTYNLATGGLGTSGSGPLRFVEGISADLSTWLDRHALALGIALAGVVAGAVAYLLTLRLLEGSHERSPDVRDPGHQESADDVRVRA